MEEMKDKLKQEIKNEVETLGKIINILEKKIVNLIQVTDISKP